MAVYTMVTKKTIIVILVGLIVVAAGVVFFLASSASSPSPLAEPAQLEAIERDIKAESFEGLESELQAIDQQLKAGGIRGY